MTLLLRCRRYVQIKRAFSFVFITMLVYGTVQTGSGRAETTIIPSANVAGRYDTNIFNRPAALLPSGTRVNDFVTTVGGAAELRHESRDFEARVKVGGDFNAYVENTGLNFFNATLNGYVSLDRWVDQYVRGARLRVTENFRYTPESPGFVSGVREVIAQDNTFFTGIQGFRANTFINTTEVKGAYPLSRDLALEGGYKFALRRVGRFLGGDVGGVSFFDTNSHTWFGGPRYQLTKNDSIAAVYRQTYLLQSRAEGGRLFSTTLITLAGDYTKEFQEWRLSLEGGLTFVEPAGRSFPSGSITVSTQPDRDTVLHLTLLREARPSIYLAGGAVIANQAQVGLSHRIYERLTLTGHAAYGISQFFPNTNDATFQNVTASTHLKYNLTRDIIADISYIFTNIKSEGTTIEYQFSRHVVGFFLSAEWK